MEKITVQNVSSANSSSYQFQSGRTIYTALMIFILTLYSGITTAQWENDDSPSYSFTQIFNDPTFNMVIKNIQTIPDGNRDSVLQFECYLQHTNYGMPNVPDFEYASGLFTFTCSKQIQNGNLVFELFAPGCALPSNLRPPSFQVDSTSHPTLLYLKASGNLPQSLANYFISPNSPGTKILTFRLRTSAPKFPAVPLNLKVKLDAPPRTFTSYFQPYPDTVDTNQFPSQFAVALTDTVVNHYSVENGSIILTGNPVQTNVLNFDGINDYVALPVSLTQNLTAPTVSEITIEYWFKGSNLQSAVRFQNGGNYIVPGWGTPGNEKHLISTEGGINGLNVGAGVSDGNWHHVAMTWKRNTVNGFKSYLDGALVDQRNSSYQSLPDLDAGGNALGRYSEGNEWMNGSLDEVRIWTRELPQSEISANRFKEISSGTGLLASYHFNQGIAGGNNTAITTLSDAAPNNYTGTLNNFALNGPASNFVGSGPALITEGKSISLTVIPQGFYNDVSNSMTGDTITVLLRNNTSPYPVVESVKRYVNSSGQGAFIFTNAVNATPYYIVIKHRNSIETWSKTTQQFSASYLSYDFTTANIQAFGNNMKQIDASPVKYGIYSADVNQDGTIDLADGSLIDNDAFNFASGYRPADANGDGTVDIADAVFADNNGYNFISKITP